MQENEVELDDYKKAFQIFESLGFIVKLAVKNKRVKYEKKNVAYDIDFYPRIPPFVEIESDSLGAVKDAARELGFDPAEGLICSPTQVYNKYGINLNEYSSINFEEFVKR